ncbi:DUF5682 family protein [Janthinobacterium lividum]|uniref:DUF5682 family protein n=1 Tax=Janthinobacterium lividum TaxID=29581 RepID=UPI000538F120|nr:DUF5682 family protein [Janthinobacterium lividum]KHA75562.1 hypothetical protein NC77_28750 [Janthinobacterium lividum]QKY03039.1 ChaN family lipoprotein [Janthinobacterium lividum]QKY08539.1 ChaN family lipoprotein [Janthinobacterium lividum]
MAVAPSDLPAGVAAARARLFEHGLYFAPVRHHSPACAHALQAMLRELRPAAVLIEGPEGFTDMLPLLLDERTRPPVALLCQTPAAGEEGARTVSAFFPFCDYSPEWVALREGAAAQAQLAFIDLPWQARAVRADAQDDAEARSLMAERYLAHSIYLNTLAARAGCRDQDELWDHLFEARSRAALADWRSMFGDVFSYCAMARLDYEPAVLEAEGSLPRERHMAAHIARWRKQVDGPVVVVTGGFHTSALIELVAAAPAHAVPAAASPSWLIRYSFERLDALNGYGAGMPAPAYYQAVWDALQSPADGDHQLAVAVDQLTMLARHSRARGLQERISTAEVQAAVLQAARLAVLRGHAGPGRQDVLDAMASCFVKGAIDDGMQGLFDDVRRQMTGSRLGDVPPSAGSPPLVVDARLAAHRHGLRLDDGDTRLARLDLYRKDRHRRRSRFFHLMQYLDTGLARWQGGPDFMAGSRLELLFEEWTYAWTPLVEARLIELSADGATLAEVALARLLREEQALGAAGQARSAGSAAALLVRACVVGLHERLPGLLALLSRHLDDDADFSSVVACGHALVTLWRAREPLGVREHPGVLALMRRVWPAALFLLSGLADTGMEGESAQVGQLLALREFGRAARSALPAPEAGLAFEAGDLHQRLHALTATRHCAPGICGAAAALLFLDGAWGEQDLSRLLEQRFGAGATPQDAVRFLSGLMAAAPELLLTQPGLRRSFNTLVGSWDEASFIHYLPDLRLAFTGLKPQETSDLAEALAVLNGAAPDALQAEFHCDISEDEMLAGGRLNAALAACLERDALSGWLDISTEKPHG